MENKLIKVIIMMVICLSITTTISLSVLFDDVRAFRDMDDTDNLSGQRIGVMSGWESDSFLSPRKDLTLKRYDTTADLILALNYKQVDAISVDSSLYAFCMESVTNIKVIGEPLDSFMYTFYVKRGGKYEKLMNDFIKYYLQTNEYKEFEAKAYNIDWINSEDYTEPTGTGEVLKVGYCVDYYPGIFATPDGRVKGTESEFITRFANYYNYQIEWIPQTGTSFLTELRNEKVNIIACTATELYRDDIDYEGSTTSMTDGYLKSNIYLVVADGKMSIENSELFDKS